MSIKTLTLKLVINVHPVTGRQNGAASSTDHAAINDMTLDTLNRLGVKQEEKLKLFYDVIFLVKQDAMNVKQDISNTFTTC